MKEKNTVKDAAGCGITTIIGLLIFGGFCMFMFWLCLKLSGSTL